MQLETIIKILKENKNCLGYIKADKVIEEIQRNIKCYELIITVGRTRSDDIDIDSIVNQIVLPICKAKQVLTKVTNNEVHVFTRKLTKLHILNQMFYKVNETLGKTDGFEILSNYDLVREEVRNKEIN